MKKSIWTKIRNLNWFPAPRPLTELSIISIIELLFYILIFVLAIWLYQRWTDVAVREIDIECERLNPTHGAQYGDAGLYFMQYYFEKDLGCNIDIDIPFSKVDTIGFSDNCRWELFKQSNGDYKYHYFSTESPYLDELLDTFNGLADTLDYLHKWGNQFIYLRTTTRFDNYRKWYRHNNVQKVESLCFEDTIRPYRNITVPIINTSIRDWNTITFTQEFFTPEDTSFIISGKERHGVISKPSWYDKYDVSQFYFKVNIKSYTVSKIKLDFRIRGANNYTFIEEKPDSLDGQKLHYFFNNDTLKTDSTGYHNGYLHNRTILLHVQSKELEILQQSRIFGITALLSALITVFLAFVIITICRFVYKRHNKKLLKRQNKQRVQQVQQDADNGNESSVNNENKKATSPSDILSESVEKEITSSQNHPRTIKKKKKH